MNANAVCCNISVTALSKAKLHKKTKPRNLFYIFRKQENFCIPKT